MYIPYDSTDISYIVIYKIGINSNFIRTKGKLYVTIGAYKIKDWKEHDQLA